MAEQSASESSPDRDFDPSADMLVNDFDDERTLEEEEAMESSEDAQNELDDLHKEGDMPIEELLSMYGYGDGPQADNTRSSSSEEILSSRDLTLDKDEIARHLLHMEDAVQPGVAKELSVADLLDDASVSTSRLLRCKRRTTANAAVSHHQSESETDSDKSFYVANDLDDDDFKRARLATIQVGSDYQAQIPEGLCKYDGAPAYENDDKLLWDPSKITDVDDVEDYLRRSQQPAGASVPGVHCIPVGGHVRDDEQALYLLLQCGHNFEEAMRRRRMQAVLPADTMSLWSEEECRSFENGLRTYGKDFHLVQQNKVRTRSVGELVQFYYLWKKTERHDVFANKTRLEKKKYSLHPGTTDYMDRFLDEQENPTQHRDRSSSPNVHSLIAADHKRQQQQQHLSSIRSPAADESRHHHHHHNHNHHNNHHLQPRILLDQLPHKGPTDANGNSAPPSDPTAPSRRPPTTSAAAPPTVEDLTGFDGPTSRKQSDGNSSSGLLPSNLNNNNVASEVNHHYNHLRQQGGGMASTTTAAMKISLSGVVGGRSGITSEGAMDSAAKSVVQ